MIPEAGHPEISISSFVILLGVVQGILLTVTWLLQRKRTSLFKAFLFFSITCSIAEIFLNRTGYMYNVIKLVDFSEPLEFAIPPLIYLITLSINPDTEKIRNWWMHFIPFIAYFIYFIPFYLAPDSFKLESYYYMHHNVEWNRAVNFPLLNILSRFRSFQMELSFFQTAVYSVLCFQLLKKYKTDRKAFPNIDQFEANRWIILNTIMFIQIIVILIVKVSYVRDLGDHIIAGFFSFFIYFCTITELIHPSINWYEKPVDGQTKISTSGLKEEKKEEIRQKLMELMEKKKLYTDNLISLQKVARYANEPPYIISQVINEKIGLSFYDWIAKYRIEEAKRILDDRKNSQFTIEHIAGEVGYNSKAAFNKAFRKFTGTTPSLYRKD